MNRRDFSKGAALTMTALASSAFTAKAAGVETGTPFKLKYGPHHGMFTHHAGKDYLAQVKFAHEMGFRAWEDNSMMDRPVDLQEKAGALFRELGMTMGVFVARADWKENPFVDGKPESRKALVDSMHKAVECAKRVGAKWCTVVPGPVDRSLNFDTQTARVIDSLRAMAEVAEAGGLVMVLEPLNFFDHPNMFLTTVPQALAICRGVNSPSCKILNDLYHQQIQCGNLIPNLLEAWEETPYIQVGDNPGRKEPTTGEINYRNIFKLLHEKKFDGVVGMEHALSKPGKEGELALIAAYREVDSF